MRDDGGGDEGEGGWKRGGGCLEKYSTERRGMSSISDLLKLFRANSVWMCLGEKEIDRVEIEGCGFSEGTRSKQ